MKRHINNLVWFKFSWSGKQWDLLCLFDFLPKLLCPFSKYSLSNWIFKRRGTWGLTERPRMINGVQMKIEKLSLFIKIFWTKIMVGWKLQNLSTLNFTSKYYLCVSIWVLSRSSCKKRESSPKKTNNSPPHHLLPIHHCIILDFKTISAPEVHFPWLICRSGGQSEIGRSLGLEMLTESECDEASIKVMAVMKRRRGRM